MFFGARYSDTPMGQRLAAARACAALPTCRRVYLVFDACGDELLGWWTKLHAAKKMAKKLPGKVQIVRFEPIPLP